MWYWSGSIYRRASSEDRAHVKHPLVQNKPTSQPGLRCAPKQLDDGDNLHIYISPEFLFAYLVEVGLRAQNAI
jgi:hypothetical protein